MEWENKTELCTLLNEQQYEKAIDIILAHLPNKMDEQAWDMFFTGISMEALPKIPLHKLVKIKDASKFEKTNSYITAVRMAAFAKIVSTLECEPN